MAGFNTLTDDFDDGTLDPARWPNTYGAVDEAGGHARIPCTTGYAGLKTATTFTLTGNTLHLHVTPPTPAGATTSTASAFATTPTAGTDAGFLIDTAQNAIGIYLRAGFADPGALFLTYSADHAWLRLRDTGGTLSWDTSPDGTTWTSRRTAPTPAWASGSDLALVVEAHRDAGTDDHVLVDNVNVPPGQIVALTAAAEADIAQAVGQRKAAAITTAGSTHTAQPVAAAKTAPLAVVGDTGTAQALHTAKTAAVGVAQGSENARLVQASKTATLINAHETGIAWGVAAARKTVSLAPAAETTAGQQLHAAKTRALLATAETGTAVTVAAGPPIPDDVTYTVGTPAVRWKVGAPWT